MRTIPALFLLAILLGTMTTSARAIETRVTVHVLANDAKLIGTAAGGCHVVIRDLTTGLILASGEHLGGTGSTDRIIREPWVRGESRLDTEKAAGFHATLDLDRPTRVVIEVDGPGGFSTGAASATRTLMLLPGQHVEGDGVVMTLQGLIVNLQEPDPEDVVEPGKALRVEVGVKLLCTCPINPDSPWPSDDYEVTAELWENGKLIASSPLSISDRTNIFTGQIGIPELGEDESAALELRVNAANPSTGNYGSDHTVFRIHG